MNSTVVRRITFGAIASLVSMPLQARAQSSAPHYTVTDSIVVGQVHGFDFYSLDPAGRKLYGAGPVVVDIDAKRVDKTIDDTSAGGGFVIASDVGHGLVRNGTVFDLGSAKVIGHVAAGGDASTYDPVTHRAFLFTTTLTSVIDMRTGSLVGRAKIPGAGESGVADGTGKVFLNLDEQDSIGVLDAKSLRLVKKYSLAPALQPLGLAMDRAHRRLFAACDGQLAVVDADNGKLVAVIPVLGHSDELAFDSETGLIFLPAGRGKGLQIVHEDSPDSYSVVQTMNDAVLTSVRAVVDERTHRVFVPYKNAKQQFVFAILAPTA